MDANFNKCDKKWDIIMWSHSFPSPLKIAYDLNELRYLHRDRPDHTDIKWPKLALFIKGR